MKTLALIISILAITASSYADMYGIYIELSRARGGPTLVSLHEFPVENVGEKVSVEDAAKAIRGIKHPRDGMFADILSTDEIPLEDLMQILKAMPASDIGLRYIVIGNHPNFSPVRAGQSLPAGWTFGSASSILSVLPSELALMDKDRKHWSAPGIAKAGSIIQRDVQNQRINFRGKVELIEPFEDGFRIKLAEVKEGRESDFFGFRAWAYFRPAATPAVSKISIGEIVVVAGNIRRTDFRLNDGDKKPTLSIDITSAEIYVPPK